MIATQDHDENDTILFYFIFIFRILILFFEWLTASFFACALLSLLCLPTRTNMTADFTGAVRISLVGPGYTGARFSLGHRFVYNSFKDDMPFTTKYQSFEKDVEINGTQLKLEICGLYLHAYF